MNKTFKIFRHCRSFIFGQISDKLFPLLDDFVGLALNQGSFLRRRSCRDFFGQDCKVRDGLSRLWSFVGRNSGDSTFCLCQPFEQTLSPFVESFSFFGTFSPQIFSFGERSIGAFHFLSKLFTLAGQFLEIFHWESSVQDFEILFDAFRCCAKFIKRLLRPKTYFIFT